MKSLVFSLVIMFTVMNTINATNNTVISDDLSTLDMYNPQLSEILFESIENPSFTLSSIENNVDSCTLSAEVSYKGVSTTLSITADDCYKAGAGLAQAVKGFMNEINK